MTNMKAEKGDLIRVIKKAPQVTAFELGGIYEVAGESYDGQVDIIGIDGVDAYVDHEEYVIHRKAGEEDSAEVDDLLHEHYSDMAEEIEQDAVNSPNHYTQGKFETIEIIEHLTSKYDDGFTAHCVGTAFKYMDRAPYKHESPTECLRKAAKYLSFAIERLDAKSTQ